MNTCLVPYTGLTPVQAARLRLLEVEPGQRGACGDIESALYTLLGASPAAITGWALLVDEQPLAFLLLIRGPCLPAWADEGSAVLSSLQVHRDHQRQGLGRACLQALPAAVRRTWPEVDQLMLSVAPDNSPALALYQSQGWVERGTAYRAAVGYERRYVLGLPPQPGPVTFSRCPA